MTSNTETHWREVAALPDEQQAEWIKEHGRPTGETGRREWLRDFINGALEVDEDDRSSLMRSLLASLLSMGDDEAKAYAGDFQWVLDHGKGDVAFAAIKGLHTGARGLTVEDALRLGHLWPRVFGKDIAATV